MSIMPEPGQSSAKRKKRQRRLSEWVMTQGSVRIDGLVHRFRISTMTVHRDLDELESRGLLRKSSGLVTVLSSSLVESSDIFRSSQEIAAKIELAQYAIQYFEPGQAVFLDASRNVQQLVPRQRSRHSTASSSPRRTSTTSSRRSS